MKDYLLAETLDLLAAILEQTPHPLTDQTAELVTLVGPLIKLLDRGGEEVRQTLEVLESYTMLAPLQPFHGELFEMCEPLLGTSKQETSTKVLRLLERLVQAEVMTNQAAGIPKFVEVMLRTKLPVRLLDGMESAWSARQTTGPKRKTAKIDGVVETDYIAIFARLLSAHPESVYRAIQVVSENYELGTLQELTTKFIEEIFFHFDNVGDLARKKLIGAVLTQMLTHNAPFGDIVRSHFQELVSIWTDVITNLNAAAPEPTNLELGPGKPVDCLLMDFTIPHSDPHITPEALRVRTFEAADPVYTVSFPNFVCDQFISFVEKCGGEAAFTANYWVHVDKEVTEGFRALNLW
jgi:hypothetical protein